MSPPGRTTNVLPGWGSVGADVVSAIQRHVPFILQSVFRRVATADASDGEKPEPFAALLVTGYLNLVKPATRRHSIGVIPGGWILDNLAIAEHGVVTIDFERSLFAGGMAPTQQARELRNCLNAFLASRLYFRDDVGDLLGALSHIASISEEWRLDFCYNGSIARSVENMAPQRFLSLIMTSYNLTDYKFYPGGRAGR